MPTNEQLAPPAEAMEETLSGFAARRVRKGKPHRFSMECWVGEREKGRRTDGEVGAVGGDGHGEGGVGGAEEGDLRLELAGLDCGGGGDGGDEGGEQREGREDGEGLHGSGGDAWETGYGRMCVIQKWQAENGRGSGGLLIGEACKPLYSLGDIIILQALCHDTLSDGHHHGDHLV
ncbi:hypothetical protein MMC26_005210 [Xylographa opegraphella]|nr:hypothetical protein [Xylographa opegraphella]